MDSSLPPVVHETLQQVWVDFLGHLPFIVVGVAMLVATWIVSIALRILLTRALRRWRARASLKDLMSRLLGISPSPTAP